MALLNASILCFHLMSSPLKSNDEQSRNIDPKYTDICAKLRPSFAIHFLTPNGEKLNPHGQYRSV